MPHGFSTLFPCPWHLGLLGWEAQGPVTPEPPSPDGWEELRGVTASHSDQETPWRHLPLLPGISCSPLIPSESGGCFSSSAEVLRTLCDITPPAQRLLLFTSMERLFGISEVSKVRCMQEKTLLGCRRSLQLTLLINKIILISYLYNPFLISSLVIFYNLISIAVPACNL